jgi:hypothetical protein
MEQELYGTTKTNHTWNYLEEIFPSMFEMQQAEGECVKMVIDNISAFRRSLATKKFHLIEFVEEATADLKKLDVMKEWLHGNSESFFHLNWKKALRNSIYRGMKNRMENLVHDVERYAKRLSFVLKVITTSTQFAAQKAKQLVK